MRKKQYNKKLEARLADNQDFLVSKLKNEWDQIQKEVKREKLIQQVKDGGMFMGKTLLALLLIGGVITIAVISPNIFAAYGRGAKRRVFFDKKKFNQTKAYLIRQGYIRTAKKNNQCLEIKITPSGKAYIINSAFRNLKITKPDKWGGVWQIIVFDIPHRHKWARDGFRDKLNQLGFYQLQKSVFVMPHPCEKEVNFLISIFSVSSYVHLIGARSISKDAELKKHFGMA